MHCPSCNAEIRSTTGFCPYCGHQVVREPAAYATNIMQRVSSGVAPAREEEADTLKLEPESWGIPAKYSSMLAAGARPEEIISELIRHNVKMRRVLERIVRMFPTDTRSEVSDAITDYLQTHCVACGDQTKVFGLGATPLCEDCEEA